MFRARTAACSSPLKLVPRPLERRPFWGPGGALADQTQHPTHAHYSRPPTRKEAHRWPGAWKMKNTPHLRTSSSGRSNFFLESTFTDQKNPKRQTADPLWGSPKLDLGQIHYLPRFLKLSLALEQPRRLHLSMPRGNINRPAYCEYVGPFQCHRQQTGRCRRAV
jgi:hypothetical protein